MLRRAFLAGLSAFGPLKQALAAITGIVPSVAVVSSGIATRTINNGGSGAMPANAFWAFMQPCKKGDVPSGNFLTGSLGGTTVPLHGTIESKWSDNSAKFIRLRVDMSGVAIASGTSKDLVLTSTSGSWSTTTTRANSDWTALVDTVELTSLTTTGTSASDMDKAGTWIAAFDGGTTNTIEVIGQGPLGLEVVVTASFVNTGTTHRFLQAMMTYWVTEKADTTLGPIASKGPFLINSLAPKTNPSEFDYTANWKRNGVSQRSSKVLHYAYTWQPLCRNDCQWDWTASDPQVFVTQAVGQTRKTQLIVPFADGIVYANTWEMQITALNTSTGVFTTASTLNFFGPSGPLGPTQPWPAPCSFRVTAGGSLWTGGVVNQTYWAKDSGDGVTFTLYDTLANANTGGSTGKQATAGGSITGTAYTRWDIAPNTGGPLDLSEGSSGGQSNDISATTEYGAAYHVGNSLSTQRMGRVTAYALGNTQQFVKNATTGKILSVMTTANTPAGMSDGTDYSGNTQWIGTGSGNFSSNLNPTGALYPSASGIFNLNDKAHFPSPVYAIWMMEGCPILRKILQYSANSSLGSVAYFPQRNLNLSGATHSNFLLDLFGRRQWWALRDVIYGLLASPDGSDEHTYFDTMLTENFNGVYPAYNTFENNGGTNFTDMGVFGYRESDWPPTGQLVTLMWMQGFMVSYSMIALYLAVGAIDSPTSSTYSTNLALCASRHNSLFTKLFTSTFCSYFSTSYTFQIGKDNVNIPAPGTFITGGPVNMGLGPGDTMLFAYTAADGTITVSNAIPWWKPVAGDTFTPSDTGSLDVTGTVRTNPPAELTKETDYTIASVGAWPPYTFKLTGHNSYSSSPTGCAGWLRPTAFTCPASSNVASDQAAGNYDRWMRAALAIASTNGATGAAAAFSTANSRNQDTSSTTDAQWWYQSTL